MRVPPGTLKRLISRIRVIRQGMRLGVKGAVKMLNGTILCSTKRTIYRWSAAEGLSVSEHFRDGYGVAFRGLACDSDGYAYYAEYSLNRNRMKPMGVYRSDDGGKSFDLSIFKAIRLPLTFWLSTFSGTTWPISFGESTPSCWGPKVRCPARRIALEKYFEPACFRGTATAKG